MHQAGRLAQLPYAITDLHSGVKGAGRARGDLDLLFAGNKSMRMPENHDLILARLMRYSEGGALDEPSGSWAPIAQIASGPVVADGTICDLILFMWLESGREWPASLDVSALLAGGWNPHPFREFIVKVHSRCDLACDYCYMYEMADQSWRIRPRAMSEETAELTAMRIGEHAGTHDMTDISLILHGGEPLLAGRELISRLVTAARRAVGPRVTVNASVQTNAVGLSDAYLRLFSELGIRVGVSLDGAAESHNRHRRFASGRGSHAAVSAGLDRLRGYPGLFSGLLCTIDLRNDPIATYEALADFEPPRIDFLLPHGTWVRPPPGRVPDAAQTPYANWLTAVFDHWYRAPRLGVRLFEEIMQLLLGGISDSEIVGLSPARMVVIETDGSIEQADTLKAAFDGAPATGLHLSRDPFDAALLLPQIVARQIGARGLSGKCRNCRVHQVCGGGLYAHRYQVGSGFANPSVYCPDLMRLIDHIRDKMQADLDARLERRATG